MTTTELMLQQLSTAFTGIPFNKMLGLNMDHVDKEHVVISFRMKNDLIGNFLQGILHGGVISSVLDMVGGMLIMSNALYKHGDISPEKAAEVLGKCSTIDLQVSFLRPGRGEHFIAKAWLQKSGSKIAFTRMELYNDKEELIATGSGTYMQG